MRALRLLMESSAPYCAVNALKSCFEARVKNTAPGSASTSALMPRRVHICAIACATDESFG